MSRADPAFIGRRRELGLLGSEFDALGSRSGHPGRCVIIRGRRRVGKSRLIEHLRSRLGAPSLFYTAANIAPEQELADFTEEVLASDLPGREVFADGADNWHVAMRMLAQIVPDDRPSLIVLDELPYLTSRVDGFEGTLQKIWDATLSRKPVLLLLVGSDLSIMDALSRYDRPFHRRGTPMVVNPLTPTDVRDLTGLPPAEAFDAYLLTGGFPLQALEWRDAQPVTDFLRTSLANPLSALVASGELMLGAEFPADSQARIVLSALAAEERAFTPLLQATGLGRTSFVRAVDLLVDKGIVAAERPVSTVPSKATRYRITDPYLRFWLRFVHPHLAEIDRDRSSRTLARVTRSWTTWRGRVIEPVVREALSRLLPDERTSWLDPDHGNEIGAYWTRSNDVEIDLVAADRTPVAGHIGFVGSVKWHETQPFDRHALTDLVIARDRMPGTTTDTPLVAVSRVPTQVTGVDASYSADDLITAWTA